MGGKLESQNSYSGNLAPQCMFLTTTIDTATTYKLQSKYQEETQNYRRMKQNEKK